MPGSTTYPAALDTFPDIGPNTKEDVVSHSGAHNNEAAAIAALQAKVGIDDSADPDSLDARVAAVESGKLDASAVGSTVAGLVGGKVPTEQLPSYVDDVIEVADFASLPATGETGKIYITLDDDAQYRWSGSAYVQLVASPGSTDAVPEGTTNLYFTDARAYAAVKAALQAGTHTGVSFAFDDGGHSISVTATLDVPADTDELDEGDDNLYFTDARAYAAAKAALQAGTHSGVSFAFDDGAMSISVTASGGGGSMKQWSVMQWGSSSGTAYSCKGHILQPYDDFDVDAMAFYVAEVSGKTYNATLYELNSSYVIQSILADVGPVTAGATASVRRVFTFPKVTLHAGSIYAILHRRTSDTPTTSSGLYGAVASTTSHLAAPVETGGPYCYYTASVAPAVGNTLLTNTGTPWTNALRIVG